jgi:PAS domain S-box-containing protein
MDSEVSHKEDPTTRPLRAIFLEDNPRDAKLLVSLLKREGYALQFEVTDSLEVFREGLSRTEWDIILADFNLPNWSAYEALEALKQSGKDIPLIVVTGSLGDEGAVECLKRGAADFVLKDRPARLPVAIQRALEEKRLRAKQKQAEDGLRESEVRYRMLFERNLAGIVQNTLDGQILDCNEEYARTLGFASRAQAVGGSVCDTWWAPVEREPFISRLREEGGIRNVELHLKRKDGKAIWVLENVTLVTRSQSKEPFVETTLVEITERKEAEMALARERDLLHSLMDNLPDYIFFKDRQSRIVRTNKAHASVLGLSDPAQAVGKTDFDLFPAEHAAQYFHDEQQLFETGQAITGRIEEVHDAASRHSWGLTTKVPIRDAEGQITGLVGVTRDITEQKKAEEALRRSEAHLAAGEELSHTGSWAWNLLTGELYWSQETYRIFGFEPSDGKTSIDVSFLARIHPEDQPKIQAGLDAAPTQREKTEADYRIVLPDGSMRHIHEIVYPLTDPAGKVVERHGVVIDVTERKQAEDALRRSEERFRRLMESEIVGVFVGDGEGRLIDANAAFLKMLAYNKEDLRGGTIRWDRMTPAEHLGVNERIAQQLAARGFTTAMETEYIRKDGSRVPVLVTLASLDAHTSQAVGLAIDLTEFKRTEAEKGRLATAIEQAGEAVVITDPQGTIEYVNPAFTLITGYDRDEVLGKNTRILKSGKQDPAFYDQLWAAILKGETWRGEMINRRKDGSTYTEQMSITPVRGARGNITHFIATKQDITERKLLEEQLRQAQKMEAVGRLAGGVAHDFNNLLTIISGYGELLRERMGPQDIGYVEEIIRAGERAAGLTRQLLAFSRRQLLSPRVLNLNLVVADLEKMLRRLIGEDVELATVKHPGLGQVRADPGQIEQVIVNLAVNARDAMPQGGKLTIETANINLDVNYSRTHANVPPGPYVMLAVTDTGVGMDAEVQGHIFEPFFTTKEKGKGTGLGLATVYGIVKQSAGNIWVYSEPGRGSMFKIYLPRVDEVAIEEEKARARPQAARGSETVLVVEDEEGVRSLVCTTLKSQGYKVLEASAPNEAISIVENFAEPIHLLLTDVVMPQMNGKELANRILAARSGTRVLYMSGYTDDAIIRHGVLDASTYFLQKPFTPGSLMQKVRDVLDAEADNKG